MKYIRKFLNKFTGSPSTQSDFVPIFNIFFSSSSGNYLPFMRMVLLGREPLGDQCISHEESTWEIVYLDATPVAPPPGLCGPPVYLGKCFSLCGRKLWRQQTKYTMCSADSG